MPASTGQAISGLTGIHDILEFVLVNTGAFFPLLVRSEIATHLHPATHGLQGLSVEVWSPMSDPLQAIEMQNCLFFCIILSVGDPRNKTHRKCWIFCLVFR